jgi:hypothetical protein
MPLVLLELALSPFPRAERHRRHSIIAGGLKKVLNGIYLPMKLND